MKPSLFIIGLIFLSACAQPEPEIIEIPVETTEVATAVANATSEVFISGMMCEMGCKGTIEKTLRKTAGVASFDINFTDSTAVAIFDSTMISATDIAIAIDEVAGGGLYTASLLNE